jgi:NADPH:quinone reductase-like Zn-dependent oxidoreductase
MGSVTLPRVLGIECVGLVEAAPGSEKELPIGTVVMTALGGLGRTFDGSYAEYCVAPKANVIPVAASEANLKIAWEVLGALPEMLQTAHGCLFRSLKLEKGETLLIRGATSATGFAAIGLAKHAGATVVATTRNATKQAMLIEAGADRVVLDTDNKIQDSVRALYPDGVNKVLDLVGATTAADSLRCLGDGGSCCSAGTLGGSWSIPNFIPNFMLPIGRYLASYGETTFKKENAPWDELLELVNKGIVQVKIGKVFKGVEGVVEAHSLMERNEANGKLVVLP